MFKILVLWLMFHCSVALKYQARSHQSDFCVGHELGEFLANPYDCKLFYWCGEKGEAIVAACPPNMLFNPLNKLCDKIQNVQCEPIRDTTSTSPAINTSDIPSRVDQLCYSFYAIQRNSYDLLFLPHPHNCQQYYMCYHGQALLHTCSPKLQWNSEQHKCDLPSNVECSQHAFDKENVEVLPSIDDRILDHGIKCPLHGQHIFPNVKRCDSFIYCVKGLAVLQTCPFYQFFDVKSVRCQWRSRATCVKDMDLKYRKGNSYK